MRGFSYNTHVGECVGHFPQWSEPLIRLILQCMRVFSYNTPIGVDVGHLFQWNGALIRLMLQLVTVISYNILLLMCIYLLYYV